VLVHDHFEYWARTAPNREFGVDATRRLSFAAASAEASRLASALHGAGVAAGDRVAIVARNRIEFPIASFAASLLGAVVVPVNVRLAPDELQFVLEDAQARHVFVDAPFAELLQDIRDRLPELDRIVALGDSRGEELPAGVTPYADFLRSATESLPDRRAAPQDEAVQFYTSGTTGRPKGVVHTHLSLSVAASYWRTVFPISANERQLLVSPAFHSGGFLNFLHTTMCGASVYLLEKFDPGEVLRLITDERLVRVSLVPATLDACLSEIRETRPDRFESLRFLSYGASPISVSSMRRALEVFPCEIHQQFGQTEAPILTHLLPEDHLRGLEEPTLLLSTGRPIVGCEIRILGSDGQALSPGERGEICARTPLSMKEYYGRPEATAEALREGWIHTGDVGFLDDRGYLSIVDRLKDMIVSGGENVFAKEVEECLLSHPAVREAAVIGIPSDRWGEEVKAVIVLQRTPSATAQELMDACHEQLAGYKRPRSIDFVAELPRNANGKVLKRLLREPYWRGHSRNVS